MPDSTRPVNIGMINSYDVVGDIAIVRLTKDNPNKAKEYASRILSTNKSLKTVLQQVSPISGEFRLHTLKYLAGENKANTIHKESGCSFAVNLATCYFSPRLSFERSRVARAVNIGESVINMFAGVGCFSILIAKTAKLTKIFSIDANPSALEFLCRNITVNRVYSQVIPILGDSKKVVQENFLGVADRVLMPLPAKAFEYLDVALAALNPHGGWIHYYDFGHANAKEDAIEKTKLKVCKRLDELKVHFDIPFSRIVRSTGPNWVQIVLDIHVAQTRDKS